MKCLIKSLELRWKLSKVARHIAPDHIKLREAMDLPVWLNTWMNDPNKEVDVEMTYDDLCKIYTVLNADKHKPKRGI